MAEYIKNCSLYKNPGSRDIFGKLTEMRKCVAIRKKHEAKSSRKLIEFGRVRFAKAVD